MGDVNQMDFGGLTLVAKDFQIGATSASLTGNAISLYLPGAPVVALGTGAAVSLDPTKGVVFSLTPTQTMTINAASVTASQEIVIVVTTSGVTSFTITFGTNFKTTGTLATGTVTGKVFTVCFVSDGVSFNETGRTVAM